MKRTTFDDLEWNGKPVRELDHAELLQLCERLHQLVWDSALNFEALLMQRMAAQSTGSAMQ